MIFTFSPGRFLPYKRRFDVRVTKWNDGGFVEYKVLGSGNVMRIPKGDFETVFKSKSR